MRPHSGEQGQRCGAQADHGDSECQDLGQVRPVQRLAAAERPLVAGPLEVADHRDGRAKEDQRRAYDMPAPRDTGEWRQQLGDRQPGYDKSERGAAPSQEGPLIGEGKSGIRLSPFLRFPMIGRVCPTDDARRTLLSFLAAREHALQVPEPCRSRRPLT